MSTTRPNGKIVTDRHIQSLSDELAKAAGITSEQANKVLSLLHIDKLDENFSAMHDILQNKSAVNALGLSHRDAAERLDVVNAASVTLANLRLGVKPTGISGIVV